MPQQEGRSAGTVCVPQIVEADLSSFHETHFGDTALAAFARDFLTPRTTPHEVILGSDGDKYDQVDEEDDDDGLGYYPDGVKRTLTDEQIAIFRHSELQALQKAQEQEQGQAQRRRNSSSPIPMDLDVESAEDGELQEDECVQRVVPTKKKKKNKKKKRGSGNSNKKQWEPDPERRKRTWDVVETGLDALAYDDAGQSGPASEHVAQRRRVTYADDDGDGDDD